MCRSVSPGRPQLVAAEARGQRALHLASRLAVLSPGRMDARCDVDGDHIYEATRRDLSDVWRPVPARLRRTD